MSRVDCSNVELGGAFPQQSFIVCTMPGILTLKLEMEMKWNWSWAKRQHKTTILIPSLTIYDNFLASILQKWAWSCLASKMTLKIEFIPRKVQIYFICNSFDVSGRSNLLDGSVLIGNCQKKVTREFSLKGEFWAASNRILSKQCNSDIYTQTMVFKNVSWTFIREIEFWTASPYSSNFPNLQFNIVNNSAESCVLGGGRHLFLQKFITSQGDKPTSILYKFSFIFKTIRVEQG